MKSKDPWIMFVDEVRELTKSNSLELPPKNVDADMSLPCFKESADKKAKEIKKIISTKSYNGLVHSVVQLGPYLNFKINYEKFNSLVINNVMEEKNTYGHGNANGKVLLEHTSINPTGPVHVGRLRNSLIGDSLKRIMMAAGYAVETHFYVNDMGKQVALISWGDKKKIETDKSLESLYEKYRTKADFRTMFIYVAANKALEEHADVADEVADILKKCESGDLTVLRSLRSQSAKCVDGQREILEKLGISFDVFDYESELVEGKSTEKVLKELKTHLIEKDGMIGLNLEKYGLKREKGIMVLKRADGTSVYTLRDIAYHLKKLGSSDWLVNVVGEDHKVEMQELYFILKNFFPEQFKGKKMDVIHYAFVSFKDMPLSTRKGQTAPLDALLDQGVEKARIEIQKRATNNRKIKDIDERALKIAVASIRYNILKLDKNKQMTFMWDDALSFEGDTGPYLQYAYARAKSILAKSKKKPVSIKLEKLSEPMENKLIKQIAMYPTIVKKSAENFQPNLVASYLYELSSAFSEYYHSTKVIGEAVEEQRLALVLSIAQTLKNGLALLGIDVMEKM